MRTGRGVTREEGRRMALNDRTKIVLLNIEDEMKTSYMNYSMSVIVSRALPDVRDGLKPSQRRILVAMNDLNLGPGRGYMKCAIITIIGQPETPAEALLKIVKGPDFPTGGIIYGTQGIRDCYLNGRGTMKMRSKVQVEEGKGGRMSLVVTEIPFQVNKTNLLEKIADMVRDGKIAGISDLRDESDRDGMRIVVELKKHANPKVVLNQLFVHSPLQTTFGAIMLALVDNRPQVLHL